MGTFSKSLASCGGFIAGPAEVIEFLRIQSRAFMFTASAVPAAVGAALGALRIIRSDEGAELLAPACWRTPATCTRASRTLRLRGRGADDAPGRIPAVTPIVPVLVGDDWQAAVLWKALYDAGVYTNVALYPAVPRGGGAAANERDGDPRARASRPGARGFRACARGSRGAAPGDHRGNGRRERRLLRAVASVPALVQFWTSARRKRKGRS